VNINGAAALVTGGASGIGAAVVERLLAAGARVTVLDRQAPEHPAADGVRHLECDVADEAQVLSAFTQIDDAGDVPAVAVLNAGTGGFGRLTELPTEEWDRVMGVNARGVFLTLRESARRMVESGRPGCIVVTSSISAAGHERGMAHYAASKAAVDALVTVAARELGPKGVRVNAVAPGTTDTPLYASTAEIPGFTERVERRTPLGRVGRAADVADVVMALIGLDWVTGQVVAADGGLSLFSPIDPFEH
jgi:NAD(P)-dependent dehydrogenase (short-subunit alcohol dehydrogenase family)